MEHAGRRSPNAANAGGVATSHRARWATTPVPPQAGDAFAVQTVRRETGKALATALLAPTLAWPVQTTDMTTLVYAGYPRGGF